MTRRALGVLAALCAVVLTVAGCSGVPGSSQPQVVRTIGLGEAPESSPPAPPVGADKRTVVSNFLEALRTSPDRLEVARAYLDGDASQKWSDGSVTVVSTLRVGSADDVANTVTVVYQPVGTLSADGIYAPFLGGLGVGDEQSATYALTRNADDQWRITTPVPPGLFVPDTDFARLYAPRPLYFLDAAGDRLVPDLRYSALSEPSLQSFLLARLIAGPRPELAQTVAPFAPTIGSGQRATVTPGYPTVVQVPGAAGLDAGARFRLAAQLAYTLPSAFTTPLQLRDGAQLVDIPGLGDTFEPDDFADLGPVPDSGVVTATYIRGGAVVDADGNPLTGPLGSGALDLASAVFDGDGGRSLVAATTDGGDQSRLLLGDPTDPVDTGLTGPLSRPAWAPVGTSSDVDEAWVARGGTLWRVSPGRAPAAVTATGRNGPITGTISALAFSPEGSRLALVIASPDGTGPQVWIGSVVRSGPDVRLDQVEPVTPGGMVVDDVGWRTDTQLLAVGTAPGFTAGAVAEFGVDGSLFSAKAPDGLPDRPRSIAVSPRATEQWVTVGQGAGATVWTRAAAGGSWGSPFTGASQAGSAPTFST